MRLDYDRKALDSTAKKLGLSLILVYGSRALGSPPPNEESDLDIAVLDLKPYSPIRYSDLHRELFKVFGNYELDLVLLSQADPLFRYEILSRSRLLCGPEAEFLEQKAFAYRNYMDSRDLRQLEDILFEKKFAWIQSQLHGTT